VPIARQCSVNLPDLVANRFLGASKRDHDHVATSQPTPIRELDDVLQANTTLSSLHVSGSHTPSGATPELKDRKVLLPTRLSSASGLHPSSLAERLRMAMGSSASSSRRSSFSVPDGQGTERGAAASVTESQAGSEADDAKQPVVVSTPAHSCRARADVRYSIGRCELASEWVDVA